MPPPRSQDASGCTPPLGACTYVVRAASPRQYVFAFSASFKLRLGSSIGFSFSYGSIAAGQIGEWGGGDGLRVLWRAEPPKLRVVHRFEEVVQVEKVVIIIQMELQEQLTQVEVEVQVMDKELVVQDLL